MQMPFLGIPIFQLGNTELYSIMILVPRKGEVPSVESAKVSPIINLLLLPADFGVIPLIKEQTKKERLCRSSRGNKINIL